MLRVRGSLVSESALSYAYRPPEPRAYGVAPDHPGPSALPAPHGRVAARLPCRQPHPDRRLQFQRRRPQVALRLGGLAEDGDQRIRLAAGEEREPDAGLGIQVVEVHGQVGQAASRSRLPLAVPVDVRLTALPGDSGGVAENHVVRVGKLDTPQELDQVRVGVGDAEDGVDAADPDHDSPAARRRDAVYEDRRMVHPSSLRRPG